MKKILLILLASAGPLNAQVASVTVDANGTVLNFQPPNTKAVNYPTGKLTVNGVQITGLESDASTTVKGVTKLSVAPVSSSNPIAVGDNDSRNTNARTPTAHAITHADSGTDPVTLIISQITGLQSALDLKAPLASPTFTGVPLAPTAAVDTNTTQIATTGFVLAQAANATPIVASTGVIGTSTRYARQDHIHPAQTSVTGNAATATALQAARTINGTSFDGTVNITVTAAAGTLTGPTLASGVTASSLLSASGGSFGTAAFTASSAYAPASQGVITLSLATPNVLYTTPVTFSNSSGAWTGTLSLNTQTANMVFAGPTTGSAATPTMRALVNGDIPTLNQNTTGSAATLTTARAIYGNNFDGSAALTQIIASTYGGTGNGFIKFSGPTTSERTKTVRDATDTILELGGSYTPTGTWTNLTLVTPALGTPASGVVTNLTGTASININGTVGATTPAAGTFTTVVASSTTSVLLGTAGSAVGNIGFRNATSGTATLAPPTGALGTYTVTLPNAASTLPIFGQQITFSGPTAARTITVPDASFAVARIDAANIFTGVQTMTSPAISGTATSITNVGTFALRDTSAAFDLTIAASSSTTLTAGRTLTLDAGNVAHTLALGTTANTITFPNVASDTVTMIAATQELTSKTLNASVGKGTWTASGTWTLPSLTLSGTISGTPTWASNQAITLSTAAQPNITSLGNLSKLTIYAADNDTDSALSIRQSNSTTNGFDWLVDQLVDGAMTLNRVSSGTSTTCLTIGRNTPGFTFADKVIFGSTARLKSYTVSTLPAGTQGDTAYVTDALTPTFLAIVVGGGSTVAPVFYNGTNWVGY